MPRPRIREMRWQSEHDDKHSESAIIHDHLEGDSGKGNIPDQCVLAMHQERPRVLQRQRNGSQNEQRPPRPDRALEALKP